MLVGPEEETARRFPGGTKSSKFKASRVVQEKAHVSGRDKRGNRS